VLKARRPGSASNALASTPPRRSDLRAFPSHAQLCQYQRDRNPLSVMAITARSTHCK